MKKRPHDNRVGESRMKDCTNCKHARWDVTKSGRLHQSGGGMCIFQWKMPPLPASMYWIGISSPTPNGGYITRKAELKDHCVYFDRKESA